MLKNLALQIIVFFLIFQLASWFKTIDMLADDVNIKQNSIALLSTVGEQVEITANNKNLVIYFFAPWCEICHMSIDNLQSLYEKNENVDVIAVALDFTDNSEVIAFLKKHQLTFPILYGNEQTKQAFNISGYPSYYVVNEQNLVIAKSIGYSTELGLFFRSL